MNLIENNDLAPSNPPTGIVLRSQSRSFILPGPRLVTQIMLRSHEGNKSLLRLKISIVTTLNQSIKYVKEIK